MRALPAEVQPILERIPRGMYRDFSIGPGWDQLVIELNEALAALVPDYKVYQVKEKFGELRYYTDIPYQSDAWELISKAEVESTFICEECGDPGQIQDQLNWVRTLCDACLSTYR